MLENHLQQSRTTFFTRYKHLLAGMVIGLMIAGLFATERMMKWPSEEKGENHVTENSSSLEEAKKLVGTSAETNTDLRDSFKNQLSDYERNQEPIILSEVIANWDSKIQDQLINTKNTALSSFGEGDYAAALTHLDQLTQIATEVIKSRNTTLVKVLKQIEQALENEDIKASERAMSEALVLAPSSPDVLAFSARVDVLPLLIKLKEQARVAQIENNPQGELEALQALLKVRPSLEVVKTRIITLEELLKVRSFGEHIRKGTVAADSLNLKMAREHLKALRQLDPNRDEVKILAQRISSAADNLEVKRLFGQAEKAAANDDWQEVLNLHRQAVKINSNSRALNVSLDKALHIVTLTSDIKGYLQTPHRLSSSGVATRANALIKEVSSVSTDSPSLAQLAKDLDVLLREYNKPIDVMIISDEQTFVQVRGLGVVGKVKSKLIQLKPGQYILEGKCDGYHSVLLPVHITPESNGVEVQVICNEPL
jgi:tetratricopeptide (TPR) repeat protein